MIGRTFGVGTILAVLTLSGCTAQAPPVASAEPVVAQQPIDPFYTRQLSARGIPVVASPKVSAAALYAARSMAAEMLANRPELAQALIRAGYRITVMAESEALLDLPENRDWKKPALDDPRLTRCERKHYDARIGRLTDREYWDNRARGIGGRYMVGAEEDILGRPSSRYYGETIFVHEFAHQVLDALRLSDPQTTARIEAAYAAALREGRFRDEYAMTTVDEYWAEGTQFWFESNRLQVFAGHRILSAGDLAAYDPALGQALRAVYGKPRQLAGDPFWNHPARVPPGPPPLNTAEVC